jgi:hypothetical protein
LAHSLIAQSLYYLWQQAVGNKDLVRFTDGPPPRWEHNAPGVPGYDVAGSPNKGSSPNRMVEIRENGSFMFHQVAS